MRKFLTILLMLFVAIGMFMQDADARRFGGGRSFGISRSTSSYSRASSSGWQNYQKSAQQQTAGNRWLGPLAGLITGGMLASLFMNHGVGGGIASLLLACGLIYLLFIFLSRRLQTRPVHQRNNQYFTQENVLPHGAQYRNHFAEANHFSSPGFDASCFLREAKVQFIRLQKAYDEKNLHDIHTFTTPEVYAEIKLQLDERGNAENKTNVMSLEAELLNVEQDSQSVSGMNMQTMLASVRFNGLLQEASHLPATTINEIWHFKKEIGNLQWIVAGVQQG